MKRPIRLILLAVPLGALLCTPLLAVDLKKGSADAPVAAGGLAVTVELSGERGAVYDPGEGIEISFSASRDAYVIVYNVDTEGYVHLLFPADGRPVRVEGREIHVLPEPGSGTYWETGGKTGIEYIHALAVDDPGRLDEDELYFLAKSERLSEKKRLRVDSDPFLAFNMIDEEIVRRADREPPATDYTYFYINRRVDYPRYLCAKCHGPETTADPYSDECPEATIERIAYDEEPVYPYPPMYNIQYAAGSDDDEDRGQPYPDGEYDGDDTKIYLSFTYGSAYPWYSPWSYYGGSFIGWGLYPAWDPFWSSYYWNIWWNDYYWPYYSWWYPSYRYPYGYPYACWSCDDYYYSGTAASYRPLYGDRTATKRYIDYATTYTSLGREKSLVDSRLVSSKRRAADERLERSDLRRRTVDPSGGAIERGGPGRDRPAVRAVPRRPGTKTGRDPSIERRTQPLKRDDDRGDRIKPERSGFGEERRRSTAGEERRRSSAGEERRRSSVGENQRGSDRRATPATSTRSSPPPARSTTKSSATPYRGGSSGTRSDSGKKRSG